MVGGIVGRIEAAKKAVEQQQVKELKRELEKEVAEQAEPAKRGRKPKVDVEVKL